MESRVNYNAVGIMVLILTSGLIIASLWLSIGFERKKYNYFTVYTHEPVSGLSAESAVKYNGVLVGQVSKIELSKFNPQQTKITIAVEQGTPITTSTYATLITQGITGTTYLGLSPTSSTFVPIQKTPGEPYPVIPSKASFFNQLEKNINDISKGFKRVLTKENAKNVRKGLQELPIVLQELKNATHQFKILAREMTMASEQVSATMKSGKRGIDTISQQTVPSATMLLKRLELIAANLQQVSNQMRQNPAVLIRGRATPPPGPGE